MFYSMNETKKKNIYPHHHCYIRHCYYHHNLRYYLHIRHHLRHSHPYLHNHHLYCLLKWKFIYFWFENAINYTYNFRHHPHHHNHYFRNCLLRIHLHRNHLPVIWSKHLFRLMNQLCITYVIRTWHIFGFLFDYRQRNWQWYREWNDLLFRLQICQQC